MDFQQAAAVIVLLIAISAFVALILGSWLKSRQPPHESDALDDRSDDLRPVGAYRDPALQPGPSRVAVHQLRPREPGPRDFRCEASPSLSRRPAETATLASLSIARRERLAKIPEGRRVNPFGIGGDVA
jgi:hypothetical protein